MIRNLSRKVQLHWQLLMCLFLSSVGLLGNLGAQDTVSAVNPATPQLLSADSVSMQELVYQGPFFVDSLHRKLTLLDYSNASTRTVASEVILNLTKTGDLSGFDVVYLPWHRIQILLMQQYLKHPDSLHMDYLRVSWQEEDVFPESLFLMMRDQQKKHPGIWDKIRFEPLMYEAEFLNIWDEGARDASTDELLDYRDQEYEWALAVALNSLFPFDATVGLHTDTALGQQIPPSIRTHVEAVRAMVSSALWDRAWKDRFENRSPGDDSENHESSEENSDVELEIDPAFGSVSSITALRDSMPRIKKDLEQWIPAENRAMFHQLLPFFARIVELENELRDYANSAFNANKKPMHVIPTNSQVVESVINRSARTQYEALIYRDYQIQSIAKEKGRILVLLNDYRECIDRSKYLPAAMPSLLSQVLNLGWKKDSVLRVFLFPILPEDVKNDLISAVEDSVAVAFEDGSAWSMKMGPTVFRQREDPLSVLPDTALLNEPFGMNASLGEDSAHAIALFQPMNKYEITDQLAVKTVFLEQSTYEENESALYDTAALYEGDFDPQRVKVNFLRGYNASFEMNYFYGVNRLKMGALNSVLRSEGLSEIGMIHSQGLAVGFSMLNGGELIQNNRLVFAQSSPLVNPNWRSTYTLWYNENLIPFGSHFVLGVGGYTGYVKHELKNFIGSGGPFINQDQPSFRVVNPAYVYGLSISPALNFGNIYLRASVGYGWDLGNKMWKYQGTPMNNSGGLKSTGLMISGEVGYRYRFDFSRKNEDSEATVVYDKKASKRRTVR